MKSLSSGLHVLCDCLQVLSLRACQLAQETDTAGFPHSLVVLPLGALGCPSVALGATVHFLSLLLPEAHFLDVEIVVHLLISLPTVAHGTVAR